MRTISWAISAGVPVKSTCPVAIAALGMVCTWAEMSDWANVLPPAALMSSSPWVPSSFPRQDDGNRLILALVSQRLKKNVNTFVGPRCSPFGR